MTRDDYSIFLSQNWEVELNTHPGFGFVTYNQDEGYPVSYVDNTTGMNILMPITLVFLIQFARRI